MKKITSESRITITIKGEKVTAPAHLLNLLSIYAGEASVKFNLERCFGLGEEAITVRDEIYNQLDCRGLYK